MCFADGRLAKIKRQYYIEFESIFFGFRFRSPPLPSRARRGASFFLSLSCRPCKGVPLRGGPTLWDSGSVPGCPQSVVLHGVDPSPVFGRVDGGVLVLPPLPRHVLIQRVVWVWRGKQSLNRQKDRSDLKGWGPLVFEDVQADPPQLVNVWVVDLGEKPDLRSGMGGVGGGSEGVHQGVSRVVASDGSPHGRRKEKMKWNIGGAGLRSRKAHAPLGPPWGSPPAGTARAYTLHPRKAT